MNKFPKVIVLILSYNGKLFLDECLAGYLGNSYKNFEIVLIDNGSTDGTKEFVQKQFPDVEVLRTEKNLKYSGGFNFGLKYSFIKRNSDFVLISNNDVKADKHLISSLVFEAEKHKNTGFVIGKVYYYEKPNVFQTVGKSYDQKYWRGGQIGKGEEDKGQYDNTEERFWCDDIYWLVTRSVYTKTGGYDTEFEFQAEDFDWQVRAKQAGFKIYYTPKAKLWHKESMTIGKTSAFKAYYDARNPLIVHLKYRKPNEWIHFVVVHLINTVIRSSLRTLYRREFYKTVRIWTGFFSAFGWAIRNLRAVVS